MEEMPTVWQGAGTPLSGGPGRGKFTASRTQKKKMRERYLTTVRTRNQAKCETRATRKREWKKWGGLKSTQPKLRRTRPDSALATVRVGKESVEILLEGLRDETHRKKGKTMSGVT